MEDQKESMIVEREELMVPPNNGGLPTMRKAHFLKPILNPQNQPSLPHHPSTYHPLNPNKQPISKNVSLSGMLRLLESWKSWVDELEQTHHQLWRKVGIFDAIKASTYHIMRDNELIMGLAERWCPETNTFVFSWGESTITLEDIMILGGYSVLGTSVRGQYRTTEGGDVKNRLVETLKSIRKTNEHNSQVSQNVWLKYFKGSGGDLEHVALIVLWLSRYVFASNSHTSISSNVFSLAISLARGVKIAFAPAILALIYRDLRLLKDKIVHCMHEGQDNGSKLVLWAPFQLLQAWVWERFPALSPKPKLLAFGEPRVARWHETKRPRSGDIRQVFESVGGDDFLWRPYALKLNNWELPKFYCDQEKWVLLNSEEDDQSFSFARCLSSCVLIGIDCVEQYFPQRVAMQFALDQDIPFSDPRWSAASNVAWNSYDKPLDGLKIYLPPRLCEGDVTLRYSEWWRTPLFLYSSCVRQRRSIRKWKKVSEVLDTCHEHNAACLNPCSSHTFVGLDSSGLKAKEVDERVEINLSMEQNDNTNRCKDMDRWSKPLEGSHLVGSGNEMEIDSPLCENTPSNSYDYGANEIEDVSLINSEKVVQEDRLGSNGVEEYRGNELRECYMNLNGGNGDPNEGDGPVSGAETHMGCSMDMDTLPHASVQNEQGGERVEDARAMQVECSHNDVLIIIDDEDDSLFEAAKKKDLALNVRINRLEKILSALRAAKS